MSSTDNRIVKMVFDNLSFKKGAAETKKSLEEVDKAVATAGKGKGLLDLSSHMKTVGVTASKMAIVTTTALATITNKAVTAGLDMAKALTFDPVRSGFSEYESLLTKQNVIQNATGKSAKIVKAALNELNTYSDKTIYSFGNMTEALTSFVNAGIPLKQSIQSMKGIANASALAGASTQESESSFRAFSQALGQGFLGLQDWRQAAVTGKIGTVQFKQALIDAAVANGTLTKKGKEYVTESGKVLSATKNFDLSLQEQWANTEVLNDALGKYADTNTKLGKKAFKAAQDVRTFSAFMDTLKESLGSGWANIFTTLIGGLDESTALWTGLSNTVGESTHKFFEWLNTSLQVWKQMGGLSKTMEGFKNILAPFVAIFDVVGAAWKAAFPSKGEGSGETLFKISEGFAAITAPLQLLAKLIRKAEPLLTSFFEGIRAGSISLGNFLGYLGDLAGKLKNLKAPDGGGFLSGLLGGLKDKAVDMASVGMDAAKSFLEGLYEGFQNINFDTTGTLIGTGLLAAIFLTLRRLTKGGLGFDLGQGLFSSVKDSMEALTGTLSAMQAQIQSKTLMQIAIAIGLITASVVALSLVDGDKLAKSLGAMSVGFGQLLAAMAILVKISGAAGFVKVPLIAASMVLLASSILILTSAIALMSLLSWDQIGKGLAAVGGALVVIAAGMMLMPKSLPVTAAGLVLVGVALNAVATALTIMSLMSWEEIGKGLTATAGGLVAIALGMQMMPLSLPITAAGLVLVGVALNGIAAALLIMGGMSWKAIGKGLATLGGSLTLLALGLNVMSGTLLGSAALLVAAGAIAILTPSLLLMSKLSWEEIGKGMTALAGGLTILALAMYAMSGSIVGALALLIIAPALLALSTALVVLGQLSWADIGKGLVALAAGLTVIGIAGLLIGPVVPALIGLGFALLLLGGGLALAGAGIFLFSAGLAALMALGGVAFAYLQDLVQAFIEVLPKLGAGFGEFLVEMAVAIGEQAPVIGAAFESVITALIATSVRLLPKLLVLFNAALDALIKAAVRNTPKLAAAGLTMLTRFINTIAANLGGVITAGANLIIAWIEGISREMPRIATAAADAVIKFINDMGTAIETKGPELQGAMAGLGISMIKGLIGGIGAMFGQATSAIGELAKGVVNKAKEILKIFSPSRVFHNIGQFLVMGLTQGIQNNAAAAITAVASMVSGQIAVASQYVDKFIQRLDQQAIAATARANGLATAADRAQKAANKTKTKADDKQADRLSQQAAAAQKVADSKQAAAEKARERAERAERFSEASTIEKAQMRSEDAQNALDEAKAAEGRAAAAQVAAAALDAQARKKGLTDSERKDLRKQADELRNRARAEALKADQLLANARKYASAALALQKQAGEEAAIAFQEQFDAEAKAAADDAAFDKMTDAEKAAKRLADSEALKLKAQQDLTKAKELAFTDLDAANELAKQAMEEAELARKYLEDAESYANKTSSGVAQGGTVINLEPTEAAAIAFNGFSTAFDSATAAASETKTIEFNQYNTSPEALSDTEIYRNTNNQLTFAADKLDSAA